MSSLSEEDRALLSAINASMREYGISRLQLLKMLRHEPSRSVFSGPVPRPLLTYRHPLTGVRIQVRAGKSLIYRAWVAEFGEEVVAGWGIDSSTGL